MPINNVVDVLMSAVALNLAAVTQFCKYSDDSPAKANMVSFQNKLIKN